MLDPPHCRADPQNIVTTWYTFLLQQLVSSCFFYVRIRLKTSPACCALPLSGYDLEGMVRRRKNL